jgi:hypothetical protein
MITHEAGETANRASDPSELWQVAPEQQVQLGGADHVTAMGTDGT